ncbi:4'-phosphopantetheinyl transferase superfamily protein [uncultured Coprobacter sp.]|uniref:4'-phosphopantetheinyl transferase family protein n=1 Tax=uncultured Coprobacter sp. TaxID=1720550 RepID=UPI00263278E0|nr:4'-phosphopantetheinyl transferase family protein [uncultured Coprobacter sp.]
MPLISIQEMIPGIRIALWKPAENSEELLSILGNAHLYESIITSCKTEKRKIEKLTTRILINLLQKKETEIEYNDNGKPYLVSSSEYVSVSHTRCCIAVAISSRPIGIDVERIATKVLSLKEKFLSVSEIQSIDSNNELIHTLLLWSAKESVFKLMDATGVDFRESIHIKDFIPEISGLFTVSESHTQKCDLYTVFYKVYPQYVLTICF